MKIYIGADHRGIEKKNQLMWYLRDQGHDVVDKGPYEYNPDDDYPDYAFAVAEEVANNYDSRGVLICGSSIGVAVASNKVDGIFASQVNTIEEAKIDREHHNSNVLALSADEEDVELMKKIIDTWLITNFAGGRHQRRLDKIFYYERTH